MDNHPRLETLFRDVNSSTFEYQAAGCNILSAGFHSQPFSAAGQHKGLADGRSESIWSIIRYLKRHMPTVLILENTSGLVTYHAQDFLKVLTAFTEIKSESGNVVYDVKYKLLNSKAVGGVPQNRSRVYIVGRKRDAIISKMCWPAEVRTKDLSAVLDQDGYADSLQACLPPRVASSADGGIYFKNVLAAIIAYQAKQKRKLSPRDLDGMVINDGGVKHHYNIGYSPCLTASGCKVGFWLPAQGRRMRVAEISRLQGIDRPLKINISNSLLGYMFGNAFTLPVVREVMRGALTSTGLI